MSEEQNIGPRVTLKTKAGTRGDAAPIRLWPLMVVLLLAAGFLVFTWYFYDVQRQNKVMATALTGAAVVVLSCLWCLFFSRLKWGVRLVSVGLFVVAGVVLGSLLQFRTVTGDLIPVFDWKWNVAWEELEPQQPVVDQELLRTTPTLILADYPQFLGPDRNVILSEPELARDWDALRPRQLWRRPVGASWSGFAVVGTNAVTLEQDGENEVVSCYSVMSGEPIWEHAYSASYANPIGGVGPRSVPAIVSNRVYAVGATGVLNCLGLHDGQLIWSKNVLELNDARVPEWGMTSSPLIVDGKVIISVGGENGKSLVAYDAITGDEIWSGGSAATSFSAPVLLNLAGVDQVVNFNQAGLSGHLLSDGQEVWSFPWGNGQPHVAVPQAVGSNRVFFSAGYGVGAGLIEISSNDAGEFGAEEIWRSIRLKAKFNNFAQIDHFIYGLDDGIMTCVDLEDGSRRWKEGRYGHGQLIAVGDLMLITTEKGDVVLFKPVPDEPRELGRFTAFDHKQWNPPALAGQLLLVRTDREAACYVLPVASEPIDSTESVPEPFDPVAETSE